MNSRLGEACECLWPQTTVLNITWMDGLQIKLNFKKGADGGELVK